MCRIRMDTKKRNGDDVGPFGRAAVVDGIETIHPQYFTEAVILLVQHNEQGSIGLILNRFSQFKLGEVTKGETLSPFSQSRLFLGGDTANGALTVLHDIENIPGAVEIRPGINLGGDAEGIQQAILQQRANVSDFKWIMNQCGWPSGQLEKEIEEGVWYNLDASNDVIMCRGNFSDVKPTATGPFDHHEKLWNKIEVELLVNLQRRKQQNSSSNPNSTSPF
eukprot:CAMPEP_0185269386 /NCGR_PEP_ID=MMETSP1359-20130426/39666_1 /TAXON_ID=552665 /ORGANISM="Bigelowiella longifila, Strain CCMP242" /LENGTH=220 /DNA_ID=CAMNT_0027860513 /DNA_START=1 /DNA_END=663 /DNA_ORIENTATION=+